MAVSGSPRVAITGIGVVSPFGVGRDRFWRHVRARLQRDARDHRLRRLAVSVHRGRARAAGDDRRRASRSSERAPGDRGERSGRPDPRRYSRASLIAVIAATEAWDDAGLRLDEPGAGVLVGSGAGGIDVAERQYYEFFTDGWKRVTPYAIPVSIVGMISSEISIALELHGISHVVSTGCTSSTDAISYAAALIRAGEADVILSGGADACVTPGMIFGFSKMRAVSTRYNDTPAAASRPFDAAATASCSAKARGWWCSSAKIARGRAARRSTRPSTATARPAMPTIACRWIPTANRSCARCSWPSTDRGVALEEIGYVNYHGTSTVLNDAVESRCVRQLFGPLADRVPGSSTKSMIGHPQGASGAAGIVTAALALRDGFLPPTINQYEPDPDCDLDFIPNAAGRASRSRRSATAWASDRRTARSCSAARGMPVTRHATVTADRVTRRL